jgi:hypothetical protein
MLKEMSDEELNALVGKISSRRHYHSHGSVIDHAEAATLGWPLTTSMKETVCGGVSGCFAPCTNSTANSTNFQRSSKVPASAAAFRYRLQRRRNHRERAGVA